MQKLLSTFFLCIVLTPFVHGQQNNLAIKGKILDSQSGEQLIGAGVGIGSGKGAIAALDGSYLIKNVTAGQVHVHCSLVGYQPFDTTINIQQSVTLNIFLQQTPATLHTLEVISGRDKESDAAAKAAEQRAYNVTNVIAAKTIQLSPDVTIGNVLQRVSGVSLERNGSGDGRYAIIRGMDQRYNNTLINGIKIPSPDNKSRYVPLDIFPAELVERVEVSKTLTPDMEGDAIGGTVNMIMKNAPDHPYINASAATGYSQTLFDRKFDYFPVSAVNKKSPYEAHGPGYEAQPGDFTRDNLNYTPKQPAPNTFASLSLGNRFAHDKLGVMLSGSYQNTYKAYNTIFNPAEYQEGGQLFIKHSYNRNFSTHAIRTGINAKLDYVFNENNKISFYNVYALLNEAQSRLTQDSLQPAPRTMPGTGEVWYFGRSRYQQQHIFNSTLHGDHTLLTSRLTFNWSAVYSLATNRIPDQAEYEYDGGFYTDPSTPNAAPYVHPNVLQNFNRTWWRNTDNDIAGYANISYLRKDAALPYTVTAGGMYRSKHRDNHYDNYQLRPVPLDNGNHQLWSDIYHYNWSVFNPTGSAADANNYRSDEDIAAGYLMLNINIHKLEAIAGVRVENTSQSFETNVPVTQAGKSGTITYMDVLPSLNLKYRLNELTNLRLAYYSAIARPGFFEIVPYRYDGDDWTETGNYNLQHSTSNNIDLRYEYFPRKNEQLLLGAFYKNIQHPIEYGFSQSLGQTNFTYQPNNYGNATNYGFEFVYEKYIQNFGVRANYTYTNSSITSPKFSSIDKDGVPMAVTINQRRSLQGQSANIANVALLYKNAKAGFDAQVTWQYTGKRIALVSPYYGFDYWQKATNLFDFSAEKKFCKKFAVFVKVNNLLNTPYELYLNKRPSNTIPVPYQDLAGKSNTLAQRDNYGQTYQLGLRYIL